MIHTMNYVNLSELGAAIDAKYITDFIFFWETENNIGNFLYCDEGRLQDLISQLHYLKENNYYYDSYYEELKNEIAAIKFLRDKYNITDKIFVYFD